MDRKLVIFDKDGVLLDTERAKIISYWKALLTCQELAEHGILDKSWNEEKYLAWHDKNLTGRSRQEVVAGILTEFSAVKNLIDQNQALIETWIKSAEKGEGASAELKEGKFSTLTEGLFSAIRMVHYYNMTVEECCRPITKMIDVLYCLMSPRVNVVLITESELERTLSELKASNIDASIFLFIACKDGIIKGITGEKVANGGKKSEMYNTILSLANISNKQCWAIEDTDKGRNQAKEAGIDCLQVFWN